VEKNKKAQEAEGMAASCEERVKGEEDLKINCNSGTVSFWPNRPNG